METDSKNIALDNFQLLINSYSSRAHFSRAAGVSLPNISQILSGQRNLTGNLIRRIEHNLRLPPGWFDSPQLESPRPHASFGLIREAMILERPAHEGFEEQIAEILFCNPRINTESGKTIYTSIGPYTPDFMVTKDDRTVAVEIKKLNTKSAKDTLIANAKRCEIAHVPLFVLVTDEDERTYSFLDSMKKERMLLGFQGVTGKLELDLRDFVLQI